MTIDARCCSVLELRQYTHHPGRRDDLIALFEEHFVAGQEDLGMRVVGSFRDLERPDRFVWLRGFADHAARNRSLEAFYTSAVWLRHRDAANATLVDWDDVRLLKPAEAGSGFDVDTAARPKRAAIAPPARVFVATIHTPTGGADAFASWFGREAAPALAACGVDVVARLVTDPSPNGYPRLPVREGETVFVWLAAYADRDAAAAGLRALEASSQWRDVVQPRLRASTTGEPERLLLSPTAGSALR